MPWTWRYEKTDGVVVSGAGLQEAIFASQGDAESWLGENWRELLDSGVDQVTLFDDTRKQYGPMSLHPEGLHGVAPVVLGRQSGYSMTSAATCRALARRDMPDIS
jgi:hypothetical protein